MEQEIRFCETPHGRVAYASAGAGPVLLLPALWISHVELEWEDPAVRAFVSGLARGHRVVRYDRPGTGLSDRDAPPAPGLDVEVAVLEADRLARPWAAFAGGCRCDRRTLELIGWSLAWSVRRARRPVLRGVL